MPRNLNVLAPDFEQGMNPELQREMERHLGDSTMDAMIKLGETDDGRTISVAPELMALLQRYKERKEAGSAVEVPKAEEPVVAEVQPEERAPSPVETESSAAEQSSMEARELAEIARRDAALSQPDINVNTPVEGHDEPIGQPEARMEAPMEQSPEAVEPLERNLSSEKVPVETLRQEAQQISPERAQEIAQRVSRQAAGGGIDDLNPQKELSPEDQLDVDWREAKYLDQELQRKLSQEDAADTRKNAYFAMRDGLMSKGMGEMQADAMLMRPNQKVSFTADEIKAFHENGRKTEIGLDEDVLKGLYLKEREALMAGGMSREEADAALMKERNLTAEEVARFNKDVEDLDDVEYYIDQTQKILREHREMMATRLAAAEAAAGVEREARADKLMQSFYNPETREYKVTMSPEEQAKFINKANEVVASARRVNAMERGERVGGTVNAVEKVDIGDPELPYEEGGYAVYPDIEAAEDAALPTKVEDLPTEPEKKANILERMRQKLANVLPGRAGYYGFKRRVNAGAAALLCSLSLASCASKGVEPAGVADGSLEITEAMQNDAENDAEAALDGVQVDGEPVHLSDISGDVTKSPEEMDDGMLTTSYNKMQYDLSDFLSPEKMRDGVNHMGTSIAETVKANPEAAAEEAKDLIRKNPAYLAGYAAEFPDVLESVGLAKDSTPAQILNVIYMDENGGQIQQTLIDAVTAKFDDEDLGINVRAGRGEQVATSYGKTRNYLDSSGNQVTDQNGNAAIRIDYKIDWTNNTRGKNDTIVEFTFVNRGKDGNIESRKVVRERADCRQIDKDISVKKTTPVEKTTPTPEVVTTDISTPPEVPTTPETPVISEDTPVVVTTPEETPEQPDGGSDTTVTPPEKEEDEDPDPEPPVPPIPPEPEPPVPPIPPEPEPPVPPIPPEPEPPVPPVPPIPPEPEPPVIVVPPEPDPEPPTPPEPKPEEVKQKDEETEIQNGSLSGNRDSITQTGEDEVFREEEASAPVINQDGTINQDVVNETEGRVETPVESTEVADDNREVVEEDTLKDGSLTQEEQQQVTEQVQEAEEKADEIENRGEMTDDELDDYIDSLTAQLGDRDAGY